MTVTEVIFYFVAAATVLGAFGVVATGKVAYAALSLVFTLLAVAALYILLASEFLALVQVLLYAGGVAVLLLFALMLTRARELVPSLDGPQKPFAALAGLSLMGVLIAMVFLTDWPRNAGEPALVSFNAHRRQPVPELRAALRGRVTGAVGRPRRLDSAGAV